jgi:uncharacterized protein
VSWLVRVRLVPRDEGFYPLFNESAENTLSAAKLLQELIVTLPSKLDLVDKIIEMERSGDTLYRRILKRLDESIVTPFDREDIITLSDKLDDGIDDMRTAADMIRLHHVDRPIEGVAEMSGLIVEAAEALVVLVSKLPKLRDLQHELDLIDSAETRGDTVYRETIARLFSGKYEALEVLKWHDIVEKLEKALNRIERASLIISTIAIKHA